MGPLALHHPEPGPARRWLHRLDCRSWLDRLSNWQFVAVASAVLMLAAVLVHCVVSLAFLGTHFSVYSDDELYWTIATTIFLAWLRWK